MTRLDSQELSTRPASLASSTQCWHLKLHDASLASLVNELLWLCPNILSVTVLLDNEESPCGFDVYIPTEADFTEIQKTFDALCQAHRLEKKLTQTLPVPIIDEDWANHWKEFWKPQRILPNLLIYPSWEGEAAAQVTKPTDITIELDPGMAFGTGTHETTQLMLYLIDSYYNRRMGYRENSHHAIDVGTGSGILAFYLAKLGIEDVVAIDNDAMAVEVAKENAARNQIPQAGQVLRFEAATLEEWYERHPSEKYDLVVANIILPVILPMLPALCQVLEPKGLLFLGGILKTQWPLIRDALKLYPQLTVKNLAQHGEWISVVCQQL